MTDRRALAGRGPPTDRITARARLNCIHHLLSMVPYEEPETPEIELPPRQDDEGYVRPPVEEQTFVPEVY